MAAISRVMAAGFAVAISAALGALIVSTTLRSPPTPETSARDISLGITLTGANPEIDAGARSLQASYNESFVCMGRETLPTLFSDKKTTGRSTCDQIGQIEADASPDRKARWTIVVEACKSQGTIVCDGEIMGTGSLVNTGDACRVVFPQHILFDTRSSQTGRLSLTPKPVGQCWFVNDSVMLGTKYSPVTRRSMTPHELACEPVRAKLGPRSFDIDLDSEVRGGLSYTGRDARSYEDHLVLDVEDKSACDGLKPLTREHFRFARENRCLCSTISTGSFNGAEFIDWYSEEASCMATRDVYEPGSGNVGVDHGYTTFKGTSGFMHRTFCPLMGGEYIQVPTIMGTAQRDSDGTVRTADGYSSIDEHIIFNDQPNIGILVEGIVFEETE